METMGHKRGAIRINMEENIKILEEFTESSCCLASQEEIIECVKNLIKGYRELENNSIPKSKIKEKIEELEKSMNKARPFDLSYIEYCEDRIDVLQELMEDK